MARRQELVLVVEDNPMTRRALIEGLEMLHYRPLEAAQGEEALVFFCATGTRMRWCLPTW